MDRQGPPIEHLLRRMSECPAEFWETTIVGSGKNSRGYKQLVAILGDHFRAMQADFDAASFLMGLLEPAPNLRGLLSVTAWLLHDEWFIAKPELIEPMQELFCSSRLKNLAEIVQAGQFVQDADRREELVRLCLAELDLRPAGESLAQATDRLNTLDSVERMRVLSATLAAERRAREVREEMAKAKAMESASRYGE